MPTKDSWVSYRLRSILELLYRNRSYSAKVSQQEQFPATAVSTVGHGYSMQQGLRFLSTYRKPWTKIDTKLVNGGNGDVQKSRQATNPKGNITYWLRWILGPILSLMLPFWIKNWVELKRIEGEAEMVMKEVENVAEVVERVATVAEKVSENVADELPDNSKLKETVLLVERVSKVAIQDAQVTEDLINKVETAKQDLEKLMEPVVDKIAKRD